MKNWYLLLVVVFLCGFTALITRKSAVKPHEKAKSLFESPDDPEGANVYDFYRLRDPHTGLVPYNIRKNELAFAATLPQYNEATRSTQWQNRGPYNLGGRTRALALDITNENTILAGQVSGGMWRSDDGGNTFTQTTTPQQLHSTTCIAQDKRNSHTNVWYYGTGEQYAIVNAAGFSSQFAGDGIFKSTDGGHTWNQLSSTETPGRPNPLFAARNFDFVWQMVTDPVDTINDVVYAAVVNGIWRSADGGNTWAAVLGLDTAVSTVSTYSDIAITSTGVLYAAISDETPSGGIYRSIDGINWTKITPPTFTGTLARVEIGICPSDETQVFFICETPGTGATNHSLFHYKYLSGDGTGTGGVWTNLTHNIPDDHCKPYFGIDFKAYNSQEGYDMHVTPYPTDTNTIFLGGTDLYRSSNGFSSYGYNWVAGYQCDTADQANYLYPHSHPDQHRLVFLPSNPQVAIAASDGGLRKTNNILADTVVWETLNNGYNTGQFYTCAIEPGNTTSQQIIGGLQDNGSFYTNTADYTQPWSMTFGGDGSYCAITHNRTNYYMSFQQGKVFKLNVSDAGTVTGFNRIDPTGGTGYLFVAPFILDPLDDTIMYLAAGTTIWRNDSLPYIPLDSDFYNTISQGWVKMNNTSTGGLASGPNVSTLDISESNPNLLYFGTDQGSVYKVDSCRTSVTATKVNITDTSFPSGAYVSCVNADRLNSNNVLVSFSNYGVISIYYSSNGGTSWTPVSGNLEQNPDGSGDGPSVDWVHIYNDGVTKRYYAGTSVGLFSTDTLNGMNTIWTQEGANTIGNVVIDMIISRPYDGSIVVATHGNGIYSNKIFTPSAIKNVAPGPLSFNCYPSPFHNSITIQFNAILQGNVEAQIFDLNGRLVQNLKTKNASQLVWDGKASGGQDCASGTYIIRILNNDKTGVRKVVKL